MVAAPNRGTEDAEPGPSRCRAACTMVNVAVQFVPFDDPMHRISHPPDVTRPPTGGADCSVAPSVLVVDLPWSTQAMKSSSLATFTSLLAATCSGEFTVLMYTDSRFEDYVGQVRFGSTDRCYPLCSDSEAVAAFVWDGEPRGTQLVVFEDVGCQGRSVAGGETYGAEVSAVASARKVRSFILSTMGEPAPTRGVVHSCDEESDVVYKAFNDTAAVM
ncbi:hypothetical protein PHYPSEUDO_012968 [Phytophthora pseudosyringae]|uniref:Uncharacterized protein n=1 Tax=Phytophthora pseudosyringae TaxID=221518 RepID=A0A8T1W4I3_9STRA|nr:hypothetical protein PHYPSEUDO_012968 [Phytophthora pseudosyringae]